MKHTKGPWVVCYDGNIDSESGRSICALGFSTYKEYNDQPEMKANARLIASSPKMYAALKTIIDQCKEIYKITKNFSPPITYKNPFA